MHIDKMFSVAIVAIPVSNTQPQSQGLYSVVFFFLQVEEDKERLRLHGSTKLQGYSTTLCMMDDSY